MLGRVLDTPLKLENPSEVRLTRKRNIRSSKQQPDENSKTLPS